MRVNGLLLGGGVVCVAVGVALLAPLRHASGDQGPASGPPAPVAQSGSAPDPAGALPVAAPERPGLSPDQRAAALAIARGDGAVRSLLRGANAATLVVPWTTLDGSRLLGAGIDITWAEPRAVKAQWPAMVYDHTEQTSPPYQETSATVEVTGLTGVHVAVDLTTGAVVDVTPLPGATVSSFRLAPSYVDTLPAQPTTPN